MLGSSFVVLMTLLPVTSLIRQGYLTDLNSLDCANLA